MKNTVELEFPADVYCFERYRYGCEKAGKAIEDDFQFFLENKVVPTSPATRAPSSTPEERPMKTTKEMMELAAYPSLLNGRRETALRYLGKLPPDVRVHLRCKWRGPQGGDWNRCECGTRLTPVAAMQRIEDFYPSEKEVLWSVDVTEDDKSTGRRNKTQEGGKHA